MSENVFNIKCENGHPAKVTDINFYGPTLFIGNHKTLWDEIKKRCFLIAVPSSSASCSLSCLPFSTSQSFIFGQSLL